MSRSALHVAESGDGDDLIVLLHGFSDNADTWNKVAPALAAHARVFAVDLPGFGRSVPTGAFPLFDGYVGVVVELLGRHRGPGTVSIVGNSLGAVVALLVATEHPELVDRVVLADMPGLAGVPRLWRLALSRTAERALNRSLRATCAVDAARIRVVVQPRRDPAAQAGPGDAVGVRRALPGP